MKGLGNEGFKKVNGQNENFLQKNGEMCMKYFSDSLVKIVQKGRNR